MMISRVTILWVLMFLFGMRMTLRGEEDAYRRLMDVFDRYPHRLPGSENFYACVEALEKELRAAGLQPHRQCYRTLVPRTKKCRLTVNGQPLGPIYPMAPNGIMPVTTFGKVLHGPLLYLGKGTLAEMNGKPVEGSIAVLDLSSDRLADVFSQGARAVIFLSDPRATQWQVAKNFTDEILASPRFYMDRSILEERGLLAPDSFPSATLEASVVWEDAETVNLWVEIPGEKGKIFALGAEEAIVLATKLSTFGVVPELCPQRRGAANVALLAQTMIDLSRVQPPPARSVIAVFLGSHYSAQEGARHFYYAVEKAQLGGYNVDPLTRRAQCYRLEKERAERELAILGHPDDIFLRDLAATRARHPDTFPPSFPDSELSRLAFDVRQLLRAKLNAWVNNLNYEISELVLANRKALDEAKKVREAELTAEKRIWNSMKGYLTAMRIPAEMEPHFQTLVAACREDLRARIAEMEARIRYNATDRLLSERFICRMSRDQVKIRKRKEVVTHFTFDFASSDRPWVLATAGPHHILGEWTRAEARYSIGRFRKHLEALGEVYERVRSPTWGPGTLLPACLHGDVEPHLLAVPSDRHLVATVAHAMQILGYEVMTAGDPLLQDELPIQDRPDLRALVPQWVAYLSALSHAPEISERAPWKAIEPYRGYTYLREENGSYYGIQYLELAKGSSEIDGPAVGALAVAFDRADQRMKPAVAGHTPLAFARVHRTGYVFLPRLSLYSCSPENRMAVAFDGDGKLIRISQALPAAERNRLFYAVGGGFYIPYNASSYDFAMTPKVLDARSDAKFRYFFDQHLLRTSCQYWGRHAPMKYIGNGLLLLGSLEEEEGMEERGKDILEDGISCDPSDLLSLNAVRLAAQDYKNLNRFRLRKLSRRNIIQESIEVLQAEAEEHYEQATAERKKGNIQAAFAHEIFSLSLSHRAWEPLKGSVNDMVTAVVILMILSIPFAFAMERLLFGFPTIYKQLFGFAFLFILTFVLLYFVHPAFTLVSAPVVIFLAFIIILMSGLVIYIVMTKFRQEIMAMQGLVSKAHTVSSESSTLLASVLIGISGMRNRPLKTFLTATTIVLLTFTILVFASFTSKLGVRESYLGKGQLPERIEIHRNSFLGIPPALVESIRVLYGDRFHIFERGGLFWDPTSKVPEPVNLVYNPKNGKVVSLEALMSFEPEEIAHHPDLQRVVGEMAKVEEPPPPLFLSDLTAKALDLVPGQMVKIGGFDFVFRGTFDTQALRNASGIDGSRILPPNFKATMKEIKVEEGEALEQTLANIDISSFVWTSAELVAITTVKGLAQLEAKTIHLNLYPRKGLDVDLEKAGQDIARVFKSPIYIQSAGGAKQFFFTTLVSGSGFSEVLVPLLLGGLIIFSSLLGSIVDREREIFTYSALGLAPTDVAALFFAESSVYAIVGGVGGYLLSQAVAKILSILASWGLFHPPEMNFSSLSSLATILLVMATVILSTIYPAIKAGRSANPGVARRWKMPAPVGDHLEFVFPFTVSSADLAGVLSFLREHFEAHRDASLGSFAARDVAIFQRDPKDPLSLGLSAELSLAPFDLGVFQRFKLYAQPSDIEGIQEIVLALDRVSGSPSVWIRSNRRFIHELRNQFLLWRSLEVETVEHYRQQTYELLQKGG